jgi:hypothetical protein
MMASPQEVSPSLQEFAVAGENLIQTIDDLTEFLLEAQKSGALDPATMTEETLAMLEKVKEECRRLRVIATEIKGQGFVETGHSE